LEAGPGTAPRQVTGAAGEQRRSRRLPPVLADVVGLALLTTILCGTITLAREGVAGSPPPVPPAALRIEPGPGYSGRIVSAYMVKAGEAEAVAETAKAAVEQAMKSQPNKTLVQISAEGLKQAAQNLAAVLPTVLPIATQIAEAVRKLIGG